MIHLNLVRSVTSIMNVLVKELPATTSILGSEPPRISVDMDEEDEEAVGGLKRNGRSTQGTRGAKAPASMGASYLDFSFRLKFVPSLSSLYAMLRTV